MILQSLYELYGRLERDGDYAIAPPGYSLQKISFKVVLKPDGALHDFEDARLQTGKKKVSRQVQVPGNTKSSGSGLNPCFLWDNTGYLLGYRLNDKDPERTQQAFQSFRDKHLTLRSEIDRPAFRAVCQFLESWSPGKAVEYPILNEVGTGFGVFQIIGETGFVHDDSGVKRWWLRQQANKEESVRGQCLITGAIGSLSRLHQPKIKGVGDQPEALLVSFNDPAYESYGKEQSINSPVSEEATFRYTTALNALLVGPKSSKHRFTLADATVVFWTEVPTTTEDIFAQFATQGFIRLEEKEAQDEGLRQKVELFLKALREGKEAYAELDQTPDKTPFFILGLTGQAKGRLGVRFFYRDSISRFLDNLRRHYADMGIERRYGEESKSPDPEFPALWQLTDETCPRWNGKPDRDKIPPILSGPLLRAVITGSRYPEGLFNAVIRRIHADSTINYIRACIIKGYLTRNQRKEVSMGLDVNRKEPSYRLGRLFAALEKTQGDALGRVNATIRDRFYSAASATPGTVFPRLLRTYQHHLARLQGGRKVAREKLVQEINWDLENYPTHLNLADQGLFAIGYYHQMRDLWTSRKEHEEDKGGDE